MNLSLGFSPCPNDTFIFDALVNNKIDTEGLQFDVVLEDVQTLNEWVIQGKLDISKISYGALPLVFDNYVILNSGGALGKGVGPLLVAGRQLPVASLSNKLIAIPGENTTPHMLFSLAFPNAKNKIFKAFNEIEDWVLQNSSTAGVIIHENRFTYHSKGLYKLMDLGEYWEDKTGAPIPLGGIVARRSIDKLIVEKMDKLISKSIEYAYKNNYAELSEYVKQNAQEMNEDIMRRHIDLYVNNYSIDLGEDGKKAIVKLLEVYQQLHSETQIKKENIFCN
jgi:1,4-dihydroxy-6-naphthoate synthase